jgi:hypothetical protein
MHSVRPAARAINPSNRFGVDYLAEARDFAELTYGIVDAHTHIMGAEAARLYRRIAQAFGVVETWSMTPLHQVDAVTEALEGQVRFIAVPDFTDQDRRRAHGEGFLERIKAFHARGSRIVKFWSAPRGLDLGRDCGEPYLLRLDSPNRLAAMELAHDLGMRFMVHVADPDTWFATKYADRARYGAKRSHYEPLERLLDRFPCRWLAAHMAGWPEDLDFLDALMARHGNLHVDCSATKWMVRELSRHEPARLHAFLERWRGRVLFGSDIVTSDEHLRPAENKTEMTAKGNSPEEALDLYASRYWAYRTLFERSVEIESPIADPDLALIDPSRFGAMDAPRLRGQALEPSLLRSLYSEAASAFLAE